MTTSTTPKRYAVKTGSRESIQNTRDAIRAMEVHCAACGDRGILPNRERCDLCERYPSDEAAQEANPV